MSETLYYIFGAGKNLGVSQMAMRAVLMFLICLALIRFSGRRSFGIHTPFDNVLSILLGAILSRAVTGASPFIATVASGAALVAIHRLFAWLGVYSRFFGRLVKGESIVIFENGKLVRENMNACCITEKDIKEGMREVANIDSYDQVERIYAERNGKISVVKKS